MAADVRIEPSAVYKGPNEEVPNLRRREGLDMPQPVESLDRESKKREQLEQEIPMLKTESRKMKMEFENYKSKTELELQQLRRTIVEQKASEELMKQLFIHLMAYYGHNFGSFDQAVNWFASQNYAGGGQVSRASGAGLQNVNELVGSVQVPTIDLKHFMVDFDQQRFFGQDYTNVAASNAAGSAYTANHAVSSAAVWINAAADSSLGANHNLPEYGAMNNHNNLCNRDLAAGVSTITGSSSGANPTQVFGSINNNEKNDGLFDIVKFYLQS
ncbi:hypothetical protein GOBAR_DD03264 [Gossypium barbadense]|nr:hypothetical protein GOBAR_DD03264 [Gossypium barbadense]